MLKRIIHIVVLITLIPLCIKGQDIHFSQFYSAPMQLNPAMTGVFDGTIRFSLNMRDQWFPALVSERFSSALVSVDFKNTAQRNDYWGMGFNLWNDVAGSTNFSSRKGQFSLAYSKYLGGRSFKGSHYLSFGADIGYVQRGIDFTRARYGVQNSNGNYDPGIPSGENLNAGPISYLDVSTGLLWFGKNAFGTGWYLGLAAHHINRPNQSFFDDEYKLYTRYTVHGGVDIKSGQLNSIIANFVVLKQGPSFETNLGLNWRYRLLANRRSNRAVQIGLAARMVNNYIWDDDKPESYRVGMDAIIVHFRFEIDQVNIGLSYDINISDLSKSANLNNAIELSIIYSVFGKEKRNTYCPNF